MINKNNPFNIRYNASNKWKGLTGNHRGFCEFEDVKFSVRAAAHILMVSYRKRGVFSYKDIISTWAPSTENNTENYIAFICKTLQVSSTDQPHNVYDYARLLVRIAYFESCFVLDLKYTIYLIHYFKIKIYKIYENPKDFDL